MVVDPWLNGGQPTVAERGIRVMDILSRLKAQEPAQDVAYDYDLTLREVEALRNRFDSLRTARKQRARTTAYVIKPHHTPDQAID